MNLSEAKNSITSMFGNHVDVMVYRAGTGIGVDLEGELNITYNMLSELSKLFETDKIDVNNFNRMKGCPTCDWGGKDVCTIKILDIGFKIED